MHQGTGIPHCVACSIFPIQNPCNYYAVKQLSLLLGVPAVRGWGVCSSGYCAYSSRAENAVCLGPQLRSSCAHSGARQCFAVRRRRTPLLQHGGSLRRRGGGLEPRPQHRLRATHRQPLSTAEDRFRCRFDSRGARAPPVRSDLESRGPGYLPATGGAGSIHTSRKLTKRKGLTKLLHSSQALCFLHSQPSAPFCVSAREGVYV